jgi:hypothetical protein
MRSGRGSSLITSMIVLALTAPDPVDGAVVAGSQVVNGSSFNANITLPTLTPCDAACPPPTTADTSLTASFVSVGVSRTVIPNWPF